MPIKVFVSYDHSEDARYRDLLRAWDANTDFNFEIDMRSPTVPIESTEAHRIQAALTTKMKEATHMLVIVGSRSWSSRWMQWEMQRARQSDVSLKFAAVRLLPHYSLPSALPPNTPVAEGFELEKIVAALRNARP